MSHIQISVRQVLCFPQEEVPLLLDLEVDNLSDPASLDDVFDKFVNSTNIFKDREVLRHDYLPGRLPHREEQIRQLGERVAPLLKGARSSNIFIYGKSGTVKTAVVKYVLNRLDFKAKEFHEPTFTESHSVLLMKSMKSLEEYLNLSPLIIDTSTEVLDTKEKFELKKDDYLLTPPDPNLVVSSKTGCIMLYIMSK